MKVRIAGLHASDKKPVVGEEVVIRGYAQVYDEKRKMWLPLKTKVNFLVDGMNYGTVYTHSNGSFEFTFSSNVKGKRKVEVIIEGCKKEMEIEFMDEKEKKRIQRIGTIAVIVLIVLLIILYLIMVIV